MLFRGHTDNTIGGIRSLSTSTDTLNIRDEIEETVKEEKKVNGRRKKIDRRTSLDILNLQSKISQLIRPKVFFESFLASRYSQHRAMLHGPCSMGQNNR